MSDALMDAINNLLHPTGNNSPSPEETKPPSLMKKPPKGWEPGVTWKGNEGVGTSRAYDANEEVEHAELLKDWGFDPETHHIDGPLEYREWEAAIGNGETKRMRYYKAKIAQGTQVQYADLESLFEEIKNFKATDYNGPPGDDAFCVFLSDFQVGKGEGGGTAAIIARVLSVFAQVSNRIQELRAIGRPLGTLYVFGMGDLIEGCSEFYAQQTFTVDLNRRDQVKVVRRLIIKGLSDWSKEFSEVVVAAVGGNHGENRKDGKSYTDFHDNDDIAVFEQVYDALAQNPEAFGHVTFVFPSDDKQSLVLDVAGTSIAVTHGHNFKGAGTAQQKAYSWWMKQCMGMQPAIDATVLVSAHFHHYSVVEYGKRIHFQAPTLDGGSAYFAEGSGEESQPGLLTFRAANGGVCDVQVLSP